MSYTVREPWYARLGRHILRSGGRRFRLIERVGVRLLHARER